VSLGIGQRQRSGAALAALLATAVLVVSCSTTPPRSSAQTRADEVLADRVYAALNADPVYFFRHVDVSVDNGVADLSGYVWTTDALYRARQVARAVPGVTQVITNRLELEREGRDNGRAR
jgi:osmotically-inducible protein OsmY